MATKSRKIVHHTRSVFLSGDIEKWSRGNLAA